MIKKDLLEKWVRQGFQFHIKNTVNLNWFINIERRIATSEGILKTDIYINDEQMFYKTMHKALNSTLEKLEQGDFKEIT